MSAPRCMFEGCRASATWVSQVDFARVEMCAGHAGRIRTAMAADPEVTWPDGTQHRLMDLLGPAEEPRPTGSRR